MKLYEINQAIEQAFDRIVDPETGEIVSDSADLMQEIESLQLERSRILEYLAKMALNYRAEAAKIKEEESRLKARRGTFERKEDKLLEILDRECAGQNTDCGVATVKYRKASSVDVLDNAVAAQWLKQNGHADCYTVAEPAVSKAGVKRLLATGVEVPGVALVEYSSCSLK